MSFQDNYGAFQGQPGAEGGNGAQQGQSGDQSQLNQVIQNAPGDFSMAPPPQQAGEPQGGEAKTTLW
ncbi:MAG: hypothetical protein INR71_02395 [Terriglobus roseus]|nr:hypothetical protein [Terriglobus roseus]